MWRDGSAVLVCIGLAAGASEPADAQQIPVTADGCAELARIVYDEVAAAANTGPERSGPWVIGGPLRNTSVCESTTKTVSRAFRRAMASAGIDVRWTDEPTRADDYCLSGFLLQCYPRRIAMVSGSIDPHALNVHKAWSAVSEAVMQAMANPYSSNEIRFDSGRLRLQIGLALRSIER